MTNNDIDISFAPFLKLQHSQNLCKITVTLSSYSQYNTQLTFCQYVNTQLLCIYTLITNLCGDTYALPNKNCSGGYSSTSIDR